MDAEARAREFRRLAADPYFKEVVAALERDAYEELLRLPFWASAKRRAAIVERIKVVRDVQNRVEFFGTTRRPAERSVV